MAEDSVNKEIWHYYYDPASHFYGEKRSAMNIQAMTTGVFAHVCGGAPA
jgi:hypothetical protein